MLSVHACVQVCVCVCARAQSDGLWAQPSGCWGPALPRGQERARVPVGAMWRWGGGPTRGRAQTRAAPALCVPLCGCRHRGHHFLLRSGQAHKREGGCSPSPSSFPQMPSAAGLLLQYGPRRLSPRPWLAAGLCSALAAFMLGAPPNRLLRLLICLKSNRTSRRRSPPGAGEAGLGVCAPCFGGGAGAARRSVGPFVPLGPGGLRGGGAARGAPVVRGAGARARLGYSPRGPRVADSCRVSSLAPPRQHSGSKAGALAPRQPHQN